MNRDLRLWVYWRRQQARAALRPHVPHAFQPALEKFIDGQLAPALLPRKPKDLIGEE